MKLMIVAMLLLHNVSLSGQTISSFLPANIADSQRFLFYLHGGLVSEIGNNAINRSAPEWGPYEYSNILDSLRGEGYNVISEIRRRGSNNQVFIDKIAGQIDTLFKNGVDAAKIILVGASSGWDIVLRVSSRLQNDNLNFVIMGGCWPDTYKEYRSIELYGNFLSIIERSDPHKTCGMIFRNRKRIKSFKEVELDTGLSHGFFYKGRKVWIEPIMAWAKTNPKI